MTARRVLLSVLGAALAAAWLGACAQGRSDDRTTDVAISGMSPIVDPDPILDGAVDEYGDPIKPTPDVPELWADLGVAPVDAGTAPRVDAGACGTAGRQCCPGSTCGNGLRCTANICVEMSACGSWRQPCCGVSACGPGLSCVSARCEGMGACGASGQSCCGGTLPCVARQVCSAASCRPCGAAGQACCTTLAPACNGSLACVGGFCAGG